MSVKQKLQEIIDVNLWLCERFMAEQEEGKHQDQKELRMMVDCNYKYLKDPKTCECMMIMCSKYPVSKASTFLVLRIFKKWLKSAMKIKSCKSIRSDS